MGGCVMSESITNDELRIEAERLRDENGLLRIENSRLRQDDYVLRSLLRDARESERRILDEIRLLKTDNSKLRDEWESERDYANQMEAIAKKKQDENAKLRELVWDLYEMAYPECPAAFEALFADRMRELGIEADK